GTGLLARRRLAVLADVAHHEPAPGVEAVAGRRRTRLAALGQLLDELHVPPGGGRERAGVVVAVAGPLEAVGGELVPLLAGDFAGLAADADRRVGVEARGGSGRGGRAAPERLDHALEEHRQLTG